MPLDFTAIDFETANSFKVSACAVGASKVRDGAIVAESAWLIQPPAPFSDFDSRNVDLHGITAERAGAGAGFDVVLDELTHFIGEDLVAAHNSAFDAAVVRLAAAACSVPHPDWTYSCTVQLARGTYQLPSFSLPRVAEAARVPLLRHHDPQQDARACAGILCDIAFRHGCADVPGLHRKLEIPLSFAEPARPIEERDWLRWPGE